MASTAAFAALALLLAVAVPTAMAVDYTVGDADGWSNSGAYDRWASGKTFNKGDTLTFNYDSSHTVVRVGTKDEYDSCSTANALKTDASSPTTVTLDKAGTIYYFVCGTTIHCNSGMKLSVTTAAAGGSTPATPTTPATPSSPGATPSTPSDTPSTPTTTTTPPSTPKTSAAPSATVAAAAATVAGVLAAALLA